MSDLRNAILATIIYYDVFDFPLTLPEVHKYLINPGRFSIENVKSSVFNIEAVFNIEVAEFAIELANMERAGIVGHKNGFYFLPGRDVLYELRIEREKIAAQKWKKFLRIAKWFQAVPYLRGILASGSMALGNTDKESDFDVLVIAVSGRLYICRILLSLAASLFRARRTRYERSAPDKFCFNHYITDGNLNIKYESLYNAQTYINLKPVLARNGIFGRFYAENIWLNKYVRSDLGTSFGFRRSDLGFRISPNSILLTIAKLGELILNSPIGNLVELLAKKYQQKRIKNNPATHESGGRIIFTDKELEFHPRSFEKTVIAAYNKNIKNLGILFPEETDSGLLE